MVFHEQASQIALRLPGGGGNAAPCRRAGHFLAAMAVGNYQTVYLQSIGFPATDFGLLNAIGLCRRYFRHDVLGHGERPYRQRAQNCHFNADARLRPFHFCAAHSDGAILLDAVISNLDPIINFFRVPMSPFVDNLTVRNCAEHRLNYGMVRSSGSLLFAIAGVITVNALIPAAGVPSTFWVMGIVMVPAIVLTYFCFEPQSGKRVKKSAAGAGVLLKNYAYMTFLIFAFFFQMAVRLKRTF